MRKRKKRQRGSHDNWLAEVSDFLLKIRMMNYDHCEKKRICLALSQHVKQYVDDAGNLA